MKNKTAVILCALVCPGTFFALNGERITANPFLRETPVRDVAFSVGKSPLSPRRAILRMSRPPSGLRQPTRQGPA